MPTIYTHGIVGILDAFTTGVKHQLLRQPPPPNRTIGGQCRISREKRHCSPIWRLIWRRGSNSPKKMQVCVV